MKNWRHTYIRTHTMESKNSQSGRPLFLFTYPRVASNLFVKMLSLQDQPNILSNNLGGYFFLTAFIRIRDSKLHNAHVDDWTEEVRKEVKSLYQDGFEQLLASIDQARSEDKVLFVKEHANLLASPITQSQYAWGRNTNNNFDWRLQIPLSSGLQPQYSPLNDTVLPDALLQKIHPAFLIRHPALVFPSNYRVSLKTEGPGGDAMKHEALNYTMTLRWSRRLYEFFESSLALASNSSQPQPIIIDAYDVINSPRQLLPRFCALVGLDSSKLSFAWKRTPDEARDRLTQANGPTVATYLSTIWASDGIMKEKAMHSPEEIDISLEARQWQKEFGEAEAWKLEEWVRQAMPDYIYMWERRLKPEPEGKEDKQEVTANLTSSCRAIFVQSVPLLRKLCSSVLQFFRTSKPSKNNQ